VRDWRTGSLRERRRGVWEIRVAVATEPNTGRAIQRSFMWHGDRADAEARCGELAADYAAHRRVCQAAPFVTVDDVLELWLAGDHDWRPSTWSGYRSNVRALRADPIVGLRVARLDPLTVRAAIGRWRTGGVTDSVLSGRFRTLAAALSWAHQERVIERNPLDGMRGPPQPAPRLHAPIADVVRLLRHAEQLVDKARADADSGVAAVRRLHRAEQTLLLVRLAADTGARRGELAALKIRDLQGRVLLIARAASMEQIGPTKTRRSRRLTIGATTATLWHDLVARWSTRVPDQESLGEWLFSSDLTHRSRLSTSHLAHCFARLRAAAGAPEVSLHRLRHGVATFLVDRGEILKAQHRLGHRDPSTTLRNYAHALPLEDQAVADAIDALLAPSRQ
jgi:integrase